MNKIIAVDFDGTLCVNEWPGIGAPNKCLIKYLKEQQHKGAKLILWTCRTKEQLVEAIEWCERHDLYFNAINQNVPESIELFGEDTRKIFANEYFDDRNVFFSNLPYKGE